jgi:hypothetical protein
MLKMPLFISEWTVCTPAAFRFIDAQYVDAFFADGSLRVSSFARFAKYPDEQRFDDDEGKTYFVHRTTQRGGQTISAVTTQGINAYVLCTAMNCNAENKEAFGPSYFRIGDTTAFGTAIARHIPNLVAGFEGPCMYQNKKIIVRDVGYIDLDQFKDPTSGQVDMQLVSDFVFGQLQHYGVFLKAATFRNQAEYRFVWLTRGPAQEYLDLKVPEARTVCENSDCTRLME